MGLRGLMGNRTGSYSFGLKFPYYKVRYKISKIRSLTAVIRASLRPHMRRQVLQRKEVVFSGSRPPLINGLKEVK